MTSRLLHVVNGTTLIDPMRAAGIDGPIIPWNDVLHEGPVPAGLGPAALRELRADFLSSCGWGRHVDILNELSRRDEALDAALDAGSSETTLGNRPTLRVDEIVLWLEFDLYDQLQLLQVLDRLPMDDAPRVTAVPDGEYLGRQPASRFADLFAARRDVTSGERVAAHDGWTAFRSSDPREVVGVLPRVTALRHLPGALTRHLEQFPAVETGLSRTEQQALEAVAAGATRLRDVYEQSHLAREPAVFMGDAAFLAHLTALLRGSSPLLRAAHGSRDVTLDAAVELTDEGRRVLEQHADRVALCGIDRWLGGVHLSGRGPVWRWDQARRIVRMA
ncbi:MAG: hypothetical protein ACT4QD_15515 [Acidobacteriota bacterium]